MASNRKGSAMLACVIHPDNTAARRFPGVALLLTVVAGLLFALPATTDWMQFDRTVISGGQWWRLVTCHWTHWSLDHLLWDVAVFAFLGSLCERDGRVQFVICVAASTIAIVLAVWCLQPQMMTYRGLSGIDSALFALLSVTIVREKISLRQWAWVVVAGLMFLAFGAKLVFEAKHGVAVFTDSTTGSFMPVPLAHAVGAVVGVAIGVTTIVSKCNREGKGTFYFTGRFVKQISG